MTETDSLIRLFRVLMSPAAKEHAARVLDSGYVGQGPEVEEFEKELGSELGVDPHEVVTLNSCTSAVSLALHLAGAGPGTEVISTPMTCSATNTPIVTRGARIVWADVDPATGLISPKDVAAKVTSRTRAVVAVDWSGSLCDYEALRRAAPGVPIVQDAAHRGPSAISGSGTNCRGRGDYVCFSFQAVKFVTTCDGGALVAGRGDAARARLLRWYGLDRRLSGEERVQQSIAEAGYKFHLNDLAAAIGRANLPLCRWAVGRHRENAAAYTRELRGLSAVGLPPDDPDSHWWIYTTFVNDPSSFIAHLGEHGVEASQVHKRNDLHPGLGASPTPLPGVDAFASHEVAIPVGWWVEERDRARVVDAVRSWGAANTPQARRAAL